MSIDEHDIDIRRLQYQGDYVANRLARVRDGPALVSYHLTKEQLATLKESCKPSRSIYGLPLNTAWRTLGEEMGFQWETLQREGTGNTPWFYAVPIAGWTKLSIAVAPVAPAFVPIADTDCAIATMSLKADIACAIAAGETAIAAELAAQLPNASDHLKAMIDVYEASKHQPALQPKDAHETKI